MQHVAHTFLGQLASYSRATRMYHTTPILLVAASYAPGMSTSIVCSERTALGLTLCPFYQVSAQFASTPTPLSAYAVSSLPWSNGAAWTGAWGYPALPCSASFWV